MVDLVEHAPSAAVTKRPAQASLVEPAGPRPHRISIGRIGTYTFLVGAAVFFLLPLYVMVVTSLKPMEEIRQGNLLAWPMAPTIAPWVKAWSSACTGLQCEGLKVGFVNSVLITVPSVVLSITLGMVNGYALSFWRVPFAKWLFGTLMLGAFIPYQVLFYPLVRMVAALGLFGSLPGIIMVQVVFSLPVMTLLFRNYYAAIPLDLFKAARVDGAGFWRTLSAIMLPLSGPIIVVACILKATHTWNDYILGLIFAGRENLPMTVQLNNIVNSTMGEREYNMEMAATLLTALVPLIVYFASGRWFVRGIAAGAVKG
jgi:glucose/mannose transport system permease protein